MKQKIVTVFGGSGFIGRYVVRILARQGLQVRIACRRPEEGLRCKPMGDVGQIVPVAANIRNQDSIAAAMEGSDSVINLIGILYKRGPQIFNSIHIESDNKYNIETELEDYVKRGGKLFIEYAEQLIKKPNFNYKIIQLESIRFFLKKSPKKDYSMIAKHIEELFL